MNADLKPRKPMIFVFGSNLAGRHGKGAALFARQERGAVYGVGVGLTGNAYAIPTKDAHLDTLPLDVVHGHVDTFLSYACAHPDLAFEVTRIGCGLAGYTDAQIAPMFAGAPSNCLLPREWQANATLDHLLTMRECVLIRRGGHGDSLANAEAFLLCIGHDMPEAAEALIEDLTANTQNYSDELGIPPEQVTHYANRLREGIRSSHITAYYSEKKRPGQGQAQPR